jgi:hypothetical protein
VNLSWATLTTILECVGVWLAPPSIGATGATALAVLRRRSSEQTDRWVRVATAAGFIIGMPLAIFSFIFLERIF